jgi:hypothetical protein
LDNHSLISDDPSPSGVSKSSVADEAVGNIEVVFGVCKRHCKQRHSGLSGSALIAVVAETASLTVFIIGSLIGKVPSPFVPVLIGLHPESGFGPAEGRLAEVLLLGNVV